MMNHSPSPRVASRNVRNRAEIILVVIDVSKEISKHALEWSLNNVVQPGDSIILLALMPVSTCGWMFWRLRNSQKESVKKRNKRHEEAKRSCQFVMQQLENLCDMKKVQITARIIPAATQGVTSMEAKRVGATWIVLDRHTKREEKSCLELQSNLVIVNRLSSKILRLNLKQSTQNSVPDVSSLINGSRGLYSLKKQGPTILRTPVNSSPDLEPPFTPPTDRENSSTSSSEPSTSPFSSAIPSGQAAAESDDASNYHVVSDSDIEDSSSNVSASRKFSRSSSFTCPYRQRSFRGTSSFLEFPRRSSTSSRFSSASSSRKENDRSLNPLALPTLPHSVSSPKLNEMLVPLKRTNSLRSSNSVDRNEGSGNKYDEYEVQGQAELARSTSVRKAVSLSAHTPLGPPPLCSICQHSSPDFGRPPIAFTFEELELATAGFSKANFLAEGGFGSVHRGILPDGQVVAVKQHKLASSQGDVEFCSEVEVLSCAQHRNVVMLIGYCIENNRRLLVYEFICNGSLDSHLYRRGKVALEWKSRQKIAVGAARGLRYLHEECRVGCIVHRDLRPNNILLTHDYEPMVGDFGLARWQPDGDLGVETRVIGTFGYLAPEYTQSGQITEKADVYSFGVVLLEIVTGRKAIDISRPKGQQCLTEWARPLLRDHGMQQQQQQQHSSELVDPRLGIRYNGREVDWMLHAASLCICRDPNNRPRMSQILRILEGDIAFDFFPSTRSFDVVSSSGRLSHDAFSAAASTTSLTEARRQAEILRTRRSVSSLSNNSLNSSSSSTDHKLSLEDLKAAYRDKISNTSNTSNTNSNRKRISFAM